MNERTGTFYLLHYKNCYTGQRHGKLRHQNEQMLIDVLSRTLPASAIHFPAKLLNVFNLLADQKTNHQTPELLSVVFQHVPPLH